MYLVLCSSTDASALWAYEGLRQLGVKPLELVLSESLVHGARWDHRLDASGVHLKIGLSDGRILCSSRIHGAINRLTGPTQDFALHFKGADKEYAQAELQAFYLSWLNALPGVVINRATPAGLSGSWYHGSEWARRAGRAGLQVQTYRQSGHESPEQYYRVPVPEGAVTRSYITFAGEVFGGQLPESVVRGCATLASDANAQMLGVDLYTDSQGQWGFAGATPSPDLTIGGRPLLKRMAMEMTKGGRQ